MDGEQPLRRALHLEPETSGQHVASSRSSRRSALDLKTADARLAEAERTLVEHHSSSGQVGSSARHLIQAVDQARSAVVVSREQAGRREDCHAEHGLVLFQTEAAGYTCDVCRQQFRAETRLLGCHECNHYVCESCHHGEEHEAEEPEYVDEGVPPVRGRFDQRR